MPRGDKSTYTEKQKRQAEHIEEGYEQRGVPEDEAERRAWATVNKMTGGGKKSGSGRGHKINPSSREERGPQGRGCLGRAFVRPALGLREEGRADPQTPSSGRSWSIVSRKTDSLCVRHARARL